MSSSLAGLSFTLIRGLVVTHLAAEVTNACAQRLADAGQPACPEEHHHDRQDDQKLGYTKTTHDRPLCCSTICLKRRATGDFPEIAYGKPNHSKTGGILP